MSAVVLFVRAPVLGAVKTRLARGVGEARALELHRWMGERVCRALASGSRSYALTVAYAPDDARAESQVRAWLPWAERYEPQRGHDLGARMALALEAAHAAGHARAMVVGADCPALDRGRAERALEALSRAPCVLGPAHDGGYYLIGATRPLPVFDAMPWGTSLVLAETRARLSRAGLAWEEISTEHDIDTAEDLWALSGMTDAPAWTRGVLAKEVH